MRNWMNTSDDDRVTSFYAQCAATLTIPIIQNRDKRWIQLATVVNGQPLSRSLHHHDDYHSILLANAIYIVRMSVQTYSGPQDTHRDDILDVSRRTSERFANSIFGILCLSFSASSVTYGTNLLTWHRLMNALTPDSSPWRRSRISINCTSLCMVHLGQT